MPESTMTNDAVLEALYSSLESLRIALGEEDHELAQRIVAHHDLQVREYIAANGGEAQAGALRSLLEMQQSLTADMTDRRDAAAAQLRAGHQSVRAVQAYHQAESLA
jgi:hypothetical protein